MKELFKDVRILNLALKSIKVLNILRAVLTVGIIVFTVLKGKKLSDRLVKE